VHESPFLAGEPVAGGKPLMESRTALQVGWAWLVVCPVLAALLAWDSRNARSADEAIPFHFFPLFLVSLILAPMVIFRGRKPDVSATRRWLHLWLGLAIVPMFMLSMVLDGTLGWHSRDEFGREQVAVLVALAVWLGAMWQLKSRILRPSS
jgi:hypothetical protein